MNFLSPPLSADETMNQFRRTQSGIYPASSLGSFRTIIKTGEWVGNSSLYELLGITKNYPHTIDGWINLTTPEERQNCSKLIDEGHSRQGFNANVWQAIRQSDGLKRYFSMTTNTLLDKHGEPSEVIGQFHDITQSVLDSFKLKIVQVNSLLHNHKKEPGLSLYLNL